MLYVLGVIVVAIGIAIYEVPSLIKKNLKKELFIFSILLVFALTLSIAKILYEDIPNPLDGLTVIYKPLSDLIIGILK